MYVIWQIQPDKPTRTHPYQVVLEVNKQSLTMEIDTGVPFMQSILLLCTYRAESIPVLGEMDVEVKYGTYIGQHTLQIVEGSGPPLLGWDWLRCIQLDWANILHYLLTPFLLQQFPQ